MNLDQIKDKELSRFDRNATSWRNANDEIRGFAHNVRTAYNDDLVDEIDKVEALDFRSFKTPAEWNSKAIDQINAIWPLMSDWQKKTALFYSGLITESDRFSN